MKNMFSIILSLIYCIFCIEPLFGQTLFYNNTFLSDKLYFEITITDTTTTCLMRGDSNKWIGFGFGSRIMSGTYTVIYDSNGLHEQKLGNQQQGSTITPCNDGTESCLTLLDATDDGTYLTVTWERDNDPSNVDDSDNLYVFDNSVTEFEMIYAYGSSLTYATHSARGSTDVEFETESVTTDPETVDTATEYSITVDSDLSSLGMAIFMRLTSETIYMEMTGPSDRWFAIVWNGHENGDGLMYTTGSDGSSTLTGHDGQLRDQDQSGGTNNGVDSQENWTILSVVESDGSVKITANRTRIATDSNDVSFDFPPKAEAYYFAHGSSSGYTLSYHGSNKIELEIDLEAGTTAVLEEDEFSREEHGLLMTAAFGVFMPWGGLINRFLGFSLCSKISCLRQFGYLSIQLHKAMMIIAWVICMMGFITIWSDVGEIEFTELHNVLGFIVVIVSTVMTIGGLFGEKNNIIVGRHYGTGDIVSTNSHRVLGTIFILFSIIVVITGIYLHYGDDSSELTIFIAYVCILGVVWLILEFYGCTNKDSMNKGIVNDNSINETNGLPITFDYKLNENNDNGQTTNTTEVPAVPKKTSILDDDGNGQTGGITINE